MLAWLCANFANGGRPAAGPGKFGTLFPTWALRSHLGKSRITGPGIAAKSPNGVAAKGKTTADLQRKARFRPPKKTYLRRG